MKSEQVIGTTFYDPDQMVCCQIADSLRMFASQDTPYHEWISSEGAQEPHFALVYLSRYSPEYGSLDLVDSRGIDRFPSTAVYYQQKREAEEAFREAFVEAFGTDTTPVEAFAQLRSVINCKERTQLLVAIVTTIRSEVGKLRSIADAPIANELIAESLDQLKVKLEEATLPTEAMLACADCFFRALYRRCEEKKDTPPARRLQIYSLLRDPFSMI